jgi:hypothetical protein
MQEGVETMRLGESKRDISPQRFCHLIPGISATADVWKGIEKVMKKSEIQGHTYDDVLVHDSSVSLSSHDPKHFDKIAGVFSQNLETAIKTNGTVDVVTTSLGTSDVLRVIDRMFQQKKYNEDDLKHLRLFLISPWGLVHGWSEGASSVFRFGRLCKQLGLVGGDEMGFLSFQSIAPSGVNLTELTNAISLAYPERIEEIKGYEAVQTMEETDSFKEQSKKNLDLMEPQDRQDLENIDKQIGEALIRKSDDEKWRNHFKYLNKRRGEIIKPYVWKFFEDPEKVETQRTFGQLAVSLAKHPVSAFKNYASLFKSTFGGDYQKMIQLMEQGVSIHFIAGELDLIVQARQYEEFMAHFQGKGKKPKAVTGKGWTHISPYSTNQESLIKAMNIMLKEPIES